MQALVDRGGVAKWADVRGPGGPPRPRLVMVLAVEETPFDLLREAVKQAAQEDPVFDGYGGVGG